MSGRGRVPFTALAALQVEVAGLTGVAVAVSHVGETLALPSDLQAGSLLIDSPVGGAGAGWEEDRGEGGEKEHMCQYSLPLLRNYVKYIYTSWSEEFLMTHVCISQQGW